MKFLANENFPFPSILILQKRGYEVESIAKNNSGISDEKVMELAKIGKQIILTFDKDYGELIVRYGLPNPPPVVFFRYKGFGPEYPGTELLRLIDSGLLLEESFTVIDVSGTRQRKY